MANEIDIYSPRSMMRVVENNPPVHTFLRDTFFTDRQTFPTVGVDVDIVRGNRHMASFLNPDLPAKIVGKQGYKTVSFTPPLVNEADVTTAGQLMARQPGEALYSSRTPAQRAAEMLTREYRRKNEAISRREEWMCAQALLNGSIHVVGDGVDSVINFGLSAEHKITLNTSKKWTATGTDPLANLREWKRLIQKNGFTSGNCVIMGYKAYEAFTRNEAVQKMLDIKRMDTGVITAQEMTSGVTYHGRLLDPMMDVYEYDEMYLDETGETPVTKPMIPDEAVIVLGTGANYAMLYGAHTYIEDRAQNWVTVESDRVLHSYIMHHPDRRMLEAAAHPLPVPNKVDSWVVATVV